MDANRFGANPLTESKSKSTIPSKLKLASCAVRSFISRKGWKSAVAVTTAIPPTMRTVSVIVPFLLHERINRRICVSRQPNG